MKRTFCMILAAVFALSAFVFPAGGAASAEAADLEAARSFVSPFCIVCGDVNGDGKLNARDVVMLMRAIVGVKNDRFVDGAADCTGDGSLNARDVTLLMKTVVSGGTLGTKGAEKVVRTTRDAFVVVETDDFGNAEKGLAPGWRLDCRGASARTAALGDFGYLCDVSEDAGTALIYDFCEVDVGRLDLTAAVTVKGDGFSLEYRNADGEVLYSLVTEGGMWRAALPGGGSEAVEAVESDAVQGISVALDLDAGVAFTSVDGSETLESALLISGSAANAASFRFATSDSGTPTAIPAAISITANMAVSDDFRYMSQYEASRRWSGSVFMKGESIFVDPGEATRSFGAVCGTVIAEAQFLLPAGEQFSISLGNGAGDAVTFSSQDGAFYANGVKVYDGFVNALWYRLRIEADVSASSARIYLSGRLVGEVPFAASLSSFDRLTVTNTSGGRIKLESVNVYEKLAHDDYVPEPTAPEGGDGYLVGAFVGDVSAGDWSAASAYPDFEPVVGYYDGSLPESADWCVKYLVEHGVDFLALPFVSDYSNSPIGFRKSPALFDGYMYSEYGDMMKYCVVWDTDKGECPPSEQAFLDHYLPFFVENFFKDGRYLTIDNMPVVMISDAEYFRTKVGGLTEAANILIDLDDAAIALGFDGVLIFVTSEPRGEATQLEFSGIAPYSFGTSSSDADASKAMIQRSASGKLYAIPTVGVGENGVCRGEARSELITVEDYRRINEWVRDSYLPSATEDWQKRLVMLSAWNDFENGAYIVPCKGTRGFGYLDVICETYTAGGASSDIVPDAAQKARICGSYPQNRHALRSLGRIDPTAANAGTVYVNDLSAELRLPCETAANGDLLMPFDPQTGIDLLLGAFYDWDAAKGVLTLKFAAHEAVFTLGSDSFTLDGEEIALGYRLYALDGLPMIPIARLCEGVGYSCRASNGDVRISSDSAYYDRITPTPAVFALGKDYQITFYAAKNSYASVIIDGTEYPDEICGNMRSAPGMRRVTVPQSVLDAAKRYTVRFRLIEERLPYYTKIVGESEREYEFFPVPDDRPIRAYMIADAHGEYVRPILSQKTFGEIDFFIANGDITDYLGDARSFANTYELAAAMTGGTKPVVCARGNHENRGAAAETYPDNLPTRGGATYYTFRLGSIWGLVLDCGEDKDDSDPEFGGSARHHDFRVRETAYVESVIANAASEYAEEGVEHRVVIVHAPFMYTMGGKYDVEPEIYGKWNGYLSDVGADIVLSGHFHYYLCTRPGDPKFRFDPPCTVSVGSERYNEYYGGAGYIFGDGGIDVKYTTSIGEVVREENVPKN